MNKNSYQIVNKSNSSKVKQLIMLLLKITAKQNKNKKNTTLTETIWTPDKKKHVEQTLRLLLKHSHNTHLKTERQCFYIF